MLWMNIKSCNVYQPHGEILNKKQMLWCFCCITMRGNIVDFNSVSFFYPFNFLISGH